MSRIDKDKSNKELTENIRNKRQEKIENQGNTKQFNSIKNRDNSPYEEQQLPLRITKVKKKFSPPIKIGKTKQVLGKTVLGKNKGVGINKKTQINFFFKKKKKKLS